MLLGMCACVRACACVTSCDNKEATYLPGLHGLKLPLEELMNLVSLTGIGADFSCDDCQDQEILKAVRWVTYA